MNGEDQERQNPRVVELFGGDVRIWIEQDAIHFAAFERSSHDPIELTSKMARVLAAKLEEMAAKIAD